MMIMYRTFCSCARNSTTKPTMRPIQLQYFDQLERVANDPRYKRDDFTVILQPHLRDMIPPIDVSCVHSSWSLFIVGHILCILIWICVGKSRTYPFSIHGIVSIMLLTLLTRIFFCVAMYVGLLFITIQSSEKDQKTPFHSCLYVYTLVTMTAMVYHKHPFHCRANTEVIPLSTAIQANTSDKWN